MDSANLTPFPRLCVTPEDARRAAIASGHISALLATQGTMELRWYVPDQEDAQVPHDRDELYVIVSGTAMFVRAEEAAPFDDDVSLSLRGEERVAVNPGDALLVPAGTAHRFEAASPDFGTWMVFYGPEGGECP